MVADVAERADRNTGAGGSDQDEFEKIRNMSENRAGLGGVIIMQKRYEYFVRRYGRVLGMRPNGRKTAATDSTRRPLRGGEGNSVGIRI